MPLTSDVVLNDTSLSQFSFLQSRGNDAYFVEKLSAHTGKFSSTL